MASTTQKSLEPRPIPDARSATDLSLRVEREVTDQVLEEKLARPVEQTDQKLQRVRHQADRQLARAKQELKQEMETPAAPSEKLHLVLEQQQARLEAAGDRPEETRRAVASEALEQAKEAAAIATEAEQAKARQAVEQLSEHAEQALETERQKVDALTEHERAERKQAFLEVLDQERRDTDTALQIERRSSDFLLGTRDDVLAMISHDLRNLLNAIGLKAEALRRQLPEDGTGPGKLALDIQTSCKIMARWAGDLVDLSSMEAGILEIYLQSHDPAEVIERAAQAFEPLAAEKGIQIAVEVPEHRPQVVCDLDRLVQVLTNLLDNAMKFTPPSGVITVRFETFAHGSLFCVSDTGPGIPESERTRIFERGWHASKDTGGGTGLGLYIAKRVIESHRGHIWVDSRPGQGSRFCFTLPTR
jgi:signal transduction histidine kinase